MEKYNKFQFDEKDLEKINEDLREVEVIFSDGTKMQTSMSAQLSDDDIKNYYKVGSKFNVGRGEKDKEVKVKSVKILK